MPPNADQQYGTRPASLDGETALHTVPSPPLACTVCENSSFVRQVLDELRAAIREAHQYHRMIKEMSSQVLAAHEAERKRIARELHDDTAQAITSMLVRLRLLEKSSQNPLVLKNVEELRELSSAALDSVRRMAMDLRPAALDDLGLAPALQTYVEKFAQNWNINVALVLQGVRRRLPPDVELVLYRVVQEALTNVAKHASARRVHVNLSRRRNYVTLTVADDGVGFDPENATGADGSGLGLFGMRERLALVGGDLKVKSFPGGGTTLKATVPLTTRRPK